MRDLLHQSKFLQASLVSWSCAYRTINACKVFRVELIQWECLDPVLLALNVSLCDLIFRPPQYIPLTCACVMLTWHLPIWMKALGSEPRTTCFYARAQELVKHFDSRQVKW
jgi:hypothetical protein